MSRMKNKPPNWYVDNIWTCGCGSLNAAYLKKCGGCDKKKFFNMDGKEIIDRLKIIRNEISNVNTNKAIQKLDYLIDDIFMYKHNSL